MSRARTAYRSGPGTAASSRSSVADEPFAGAFNVHGIWLDADENIYLAQFDRAVSKLSRE